VSDWLVRAALAGIGLLGVAGCRATPATASEGTPAPSVSAGARCRSLAGRSPFSAQLRVGGRERTFFVAPPVGGRGPFPVVVGFHGRGGNGAYAARTFALSEAIHAPFLGLFPDGLPQPWMHGAVGWDTRDESSGDLALFDALVEWARTEACGNSARVSVVGYSWGGGMANHVGCTRPTHLRALVSVGGGGPPMPCVGSVSALIVHGTNDLEEPIASGRDSFEAWAFAAGCGPEERPAFDGACRARRGCTAGREIVWCEHPGGHLWPPLLRRPALGRFLGID
jgi:polyhydroxybutyrate depolymerase